MRRFFGLGSLRRSYSQTTRHEQINSSSSSAIQHSVLPTNVMVATKGGEQETVTFSLSLAAGTRYELPSAPGTAHFFKHSLFLTNREESTVALTRLQELRGSQLSTSINRDTLTITGHSTRDNLLDTMQSVGHMLHPRRLEDHEIELLKEKVRFERAVAYSNPKNYLHESLQNVAWRNGLGNSVFCSEEYENLIGAEQIFDHFVRSMVHQGTSAVAVGVRHDVFARCVQQALDKLHFVKFGTMPFANTKYYGGEARIEGATGGTNHAAIAFPLPHGHEDVSKLVLGQMISKLLIPSKAIPYGNQNSLILRKGPFSNVKFSGASEFYSDAALLTFHIEGSDASALKEALIRIKSAPSAAIKSEDLTRAKASLLLDLRSKFEDKSGFLALVRDQLAGSGKITDLSALETIINGVTLEQVEKAMNEVFKQKPSLVTFGNLRQLPYLDQL